MTCRAGAAGHNLYISGAIARGLKDYSFMSDFFTLRHQEKN
jgi:hypothetical protein